MKDDDIYKYGNNVVWSLPFLFQYEIIFGAFQTALENLGLEPLNANVYGSPATIWSSGRAPIVRKPVEKKKLKKIFEYIQTFNGIPTFTFSRIDINEDELKDSYANYLLDFGIDNGARFIVASDNLKNYIKEKSPQTTVVASILKSIYRFQGKDKKEEADIEAETNYYNKLLKEYDIVVVRPEYSKFVLTKHTGLINDLSRIEVLINQMCISNCPNAPLHSTTLAKQHNEEDYDNPHFYCYKNFYSLKKQYRMNAAHTKEEVQTLIDAGVRQLKLQGRGESVPYLFHSFHLASQIFNFDGPGFILLNSSMLHTGLLSEYKRFYSIIDKEKDWYFKDADYML